MALSDLQLIELATQILQDNVTEQITPGNVKQLIIKLIESKESTGLAQQLITNYANSVNPLIGQKLAAAAFNSFLITYNQSISGKLNAATFNEFLLEYQEAISNVNLDDKLGAQATNSSFPIEYDDDGKLRTLIPSSNEIVGGTHIYTTEEEKSLGGKKVNGNIVVVNNSELKLGAEPRDVVVMGTKVVLPLAGGNAKVLDTVANTLTTVSMVLSKDSYGIQNYAVNGTKLYTPASSGTGLRVWDSTTSLFGDEINVHPGTGGFLIHLLYVSDGLLFVVLNYSFSSFVLRIYDLATTSFLSTTTLPGNPKSPTVSNGIFSCYFPGANFIRSYGSSGELTGIAATTVTNGKLFSYNNKLYFIYQNRIVIYSLTARTLLVDLGNIGIYYQDTDPDPLIIGTNIHFIEHQTGGEAKAFVVSAANALLGTYTIAQVANGALTPVAGKWYDEGTNRIYITAPDATGEPSYLRIYSTTYVLLTTLRTGQYSEVIGKAGNILYITNTGSYSLSLFDLTKSKVVENKKVYLLNADLTSYDQIYPLPQATTSVPGQVVKATSIDQDNEKYVTPKLVDDKIAELAEELAEATIPDATDQIAGKTKVLNSVNSTATDAALAAVKGKELNESIQANTAALTLKVDIDTQWNQVGHSLTKGTITRLSGSNRVAALAANTLVSPATNLEQNQEVYSYVNSVIDANNFRESTGGNVDITGVLDHIGNPLVVGTKYYLSPTVAGKVTPIPPSSPGQSERFVLIPKSSTVGRFTTADQGREIGPVAVLLNSDANGVGSLTADGVLDKAMRTFLVDSSTGFRTIELPKCSDFPLAMEVVINIKLSGSYGALLKNNSLTADTIRGGNIILSTDGESIQFRRIGAAEWGAFAYTNPDVSFINALIFG